jgi:hypothetical protein
MKENNHEGMSLMEMIEEFEAAPEEQSKPFYTDLIEKLIPLHKALSLMNDVENTMQSFNVPLELSIFSDCSGEVIDNNGDQLIEFIDEEELIDGLKRLLE